jgi:hypothetical protein
MDTCSKTLLHIFRKLVIHEIMSGPRCNAGHWDYGLGEKVMLFSLCPVAKKLTSLILSLVVVLAPE